MNFSLVFITFVCDFRFDSHRPRPEARSKYSVGNKIRLRPGLDFNGCDVSDNEQQAQFERLVLPHLDAAYNLARWLAGNDHDAEDIAQDACVRAFRFVGGCRGSDGRAWLLTIVRNTAYSWLKKNRSQTAGFH